jgi:hypothetical protein
MPFTVNVGPYQGGNYLFEGLSGLGKSVGSAIQTAHSELEDQQKKEAYNDAIVNHALQNKQITLEDYTKYRKMGDNQKTGFAAGLAANFMEDFRNEQLKAMQESRAASAELRRQQADALSFEPSEENKALARSMGNELIQTAPGKWQVVPYGGSGQDEVQTDPLKVGDKVIPGIGVNRKTGQYVYFPQDVGNGVKIEVDPQTGTPFYRDIKGNPHPLTGQQIMAGQIMPNQPGAATAQPQQQGGGMLDSIINGIFNSVGGVSPFDSSGSGQPSPTPAQTPDAQAPIAAATGNEVTAPAPVVAQPSGQKVKVKSPDGRVGLIPAEQLPAALTKGYTQVQ